MAILPVLEYPDPKLKEISEPVDFEKEDLTEIIKDLLETMYAAPGCVGLAAPQCGIRKRIIIVDASRNAKVESRYGLMVLINPAIEHQEGEILAREGCLSLPDLTANVRRAQTIRATACDEKGEQRFIEASDFEARVILHEMDHLDGILFLDRVSSLKTDVFRRKRYAPKSAKGGNSETGGKPDGSNTETRDALSSVAAVGDKTDGA